MEQRQKQTAQHVCNLKNPIPPRRRHRRRPQPPCRLWSEGRPPRASGHATLPSFWPHRTGAHGRRLGHRPRAGLGPGAAALWGPGIIDPHACSGGGDPGPVVVAHWWAGQGVGDSERRTPDSGHRADSARRASDSAPAGDRALPAAAPPCLPAPDPSTRPAEEWGTQEDGCERMGVKAEGSKRIDVKGWMERRDMKCLKRRMKCDRAVLGRMERRRVEGWTTRRERDDEDGYGCRRRGVGEGIAQIADAHNRQIRFASATVLMSLHPL